MKMEKKDREEAVRCYFCGRTTSKIRKSYESFMTRHSFRRTRLLHPRGLDRCLTTFCRTADLKIACRECLKPVCANCGNVSPLVPETAGFWCKRCRKYVRVVLMGFDKRKKVTRRQVEHWRKVIALRRQEAILARDIE